MHTITVWRAIGASDLEFVSRGSILSTLFVLDEPDLLFEFNDEDRPSQLLTYTEFHDELKRQR